MKQVHFRKSVMILKTILLVLILSFTFPFYEGETTSALESLSFVHHQGEQPKPPLHSTDQMQPPAKVDYHNLDAGPSTHAPVQVIPLPSEEPDSNPSPSPSSDRNDAAIPGTSPNEETSIPGTDSQPASDPALNPEVNDETGEEIQANAGVLLQTLLDQSYRHEGEKVAYLTFDDGPTSSLTDQVLDILKEENIKASFFFIGSNAERHPELVKRVYEEGHGAGNHTYSHVFEEIYASPECFVDELLQSERVLQSILGEDKTFRLVRFPGGSFGKELEPFRQAVNDAGFGYIDWNSLNGDAESVKAKSPKKLLARLKETVTGQSGLVVLMHDAPGKESTVAALPEMISFLREQGYRFELLPGSR